MKRNNLSVFASFSDPSTFSFSSFWSKVKKDENCPWLFRQNSLIFHLFTLFQHLHASTFFSEEGFCVWSSVGEEEVEQNICRFCLCFNLAEVKFYENFTDIWTLIFHFSLPHCLQTFLMFQFPSLRFKSSPFTLEFLHNSGFGLVTYEWLSQWLEELENRQNHSPD